MQEILFIKIYKTSNPFFFWQRLRLTQAVWVVLLVLVISISDCSIKIIKILANRTLYSIEIIQ